MARRGRSVRAAAPVVAAYAASRAVTLVGAWLATLIRVDPSAADPATRPHTVSQVLSTWDGHWYIDLALHGYPHSVPPGDFHAGTGAAAQNGIAFFPLYPLLLRWVHAVSPFSIDVDAVVLSMVLGLLATVAVWLLVRDRVGDDKATRAAVLFCCFPGAFALSFAYTESAMLLTTAACLWLLARKRWVWAGLAAAAAGLSRSTGAILVLVCAWVAVAELRRSRDWKSLAAPAIAPLGTFAFFAFLRARTGSWTIWFDAERRGWGHHLDWGSAAASNTWHFLQHPLRDPNLTLIGVFTAVAVVGLVAMWVTRQPAMLVLYSVLMLGLLVSSPDLQIRPRFLLGAFPLVTAIAEWARPRWFPALVAGSVGVMGVLTVLFGLRLTQPQVLFP